MNRSHWLIVGVTMLLNQASFASELNITVTNIDITKGGNITVMIYGEQGFPKTHEMSLLSETKKTTNNTMNFTFDINEQELAIKVLHDENGDGKVTKNWTGIYPSDGLGFSNKQKLTFTGPPTYEKSKIMVIPGKHDVTISIIY